MSEIYKDLLGIGDTILDLLEQFYATYSTRSKGIETILDHLYDVEEEISEFEEEEDD